MTVNAKTDAIIHELEGDYFGRMNAFLQQQPPKSWPVLSKTSRVRICMDELYVP